MFSSLSSCLPCIPPWNAFCLFTTPFPFKPTAFCVACPFWCIPELSVALKGELMRMGCETHKCVDETLPPAAVGIRWSCLEWAVVMWRFQLVQHLTPFLKGEIMRSPHINNVVGCSASSTMDAETRTSFLSQVHPLLQHQTDQAVTSDLGWTPWTPMLRTVSLMQVTQKLRDAEIHFMGAVIVQGWQWSIMKVSKTSRPQGWCPLVVVSRDDGVLSRLFLLHSLAPLGCRGPHLSS